MDPLSQRALLHRHGQPGTWGNLGRWPAADYAGACAALAHAVGRAARLGPGQRVCSVACGAGDELALWVQAFGVACAIGIERDAGARALAASRTPGTGGSSPGQALPWQVVAHTAGPMSAVALHALRAMDDSQATRDAAQRRDRRVDAFDAVVCVDAAYHLSPRTDFMADAWQALKPGGWLAFTDLVVDGRRAWSLRAAARLCGVPASDLGPEDQRLAQLRAAGFEPMPVQRLDAAVLDGFADFVRQQRQRLGADARGAGWRRVAVTAALIGPCRRLGLGYALFAARKA